jgi:environmental stress-induced protein Ves
MHRFSLRNLPAQPWKNGGGITREIAAIPHGTSMADFTWRVSVAEIARSGPFSPFPGIDRQILLLTGAGVRLQAATDGIDHPEGTAGLRMEASAPDGALVVIRIL